SKNPGARPGTAYRRMTWPPRHVEIEHVRIQAAQFAPGRNQRVAVPVLFEIEQARNGNERLRGTRRRQRRRPAAVDSDARMLDKMPRRKPYPHGPFIRIEPVTRCMEGVPIPLK